MSHPYNDLPIGLCHVDTGLRIVEINGWLATFSAVAEDERVGRTFGELFPNTADTVELSLRQVIQTGKPIHDRKTGPLTSSQRPSTKTIRYSCTPVHSEGGTVTGAACVIEDVTDLVLSGTQPEQKAPKSQPKLDAFFVDSPAGLAIVDDQLRYTRINRTLAEINGVTVAEHIGRTAGQIMPKLAAVIEPMFRMVLDEGKEFLNIEVNGETPAQPGVARQWMVSYFPIREPKGRITSVGIVVIETTERMRAEDALRQSDKHLREAQHVAGIGSFESNLSKDELWWSDELYHLFGLNPQEYIPSKEGFTALLHPDDRGEYMEALMNSLTSGRHLNREFKARHTTGDWRYFETTAAVTTDSAGVVAGLRGTVQDITQRRQAEMLLRESEQKYRTLVEASPYCIHQIDAAGKLASMNHAGLEMMAEEEECAIQGIPYLSVVCAEDRARVSRLMDAAFAGEYSEFEFRVESGQTFRSNFVPIRGRDGNIDRLLGITQDITERKRTEQAVQDAQEELFDYQLRQTELAEARLAELSQRLSQRLIHQTRLATIGQMTASVAHEIRNPLGAVRNAAYYLKRHVPSDNPKMVQYLGIIDQEVYSADRVIRDMLAMARSKEPVKESFDLAGVIREVFDRMDQKPSVRFELLSSSEPFMIVADQGQCRQVMMNLTTNAVQAVKGDGEIRIETDQEPTHDLITVQDNGPGIAPEHRDRLFEPLFSTKAKGTGLGLSICREIIERHGGTIELQPGDGTGALFCIKLPRQVPERQ